MTVEQLMQPRYLVIADYPRSNNEVVDTIDYPTKEMCAFFDKYPTCSAVLNGGSSGMKRICRST